MLNRLLTLLVSCLWVVLICNNLKAQEKAEMPDSLNKGNLPVLTGDSTGKNINHGPESTANSGKHRSWHVGASYVNDNVYLGRKDSFALPYLAPKIGYYSKSGFFLEAASGISLANGDSHWDMVSLATGYGFSAGDYDGEITATKYFYNSQSTNTRSEMKGSLEYNNGYDFGFIRPAFMAALNLGNKTDYAASFGLEHSISLVEDKWTLVPSINLNGSTQNYYNDYFRKRRYAVPRKGKVPNPKLSSISAEVLNASSFRLLDYEFSLPLSYEADRINIALTPVYAVPVHPAEVVVTKNFTNGTSSTVLGYEKLSNSFFVGLEVVFKL